MKFTLPKKNQNTPSGIYQVLIVGADIRNPDRRNQLRLTLQVVSPGPHEDNWFYHCIMLDGMSEFFIMRFLKAALPEVRSLEGEFDTEQLVGKCLVVAIENSGSWDPSDPRRPNLFPSVTEIKNGAAWPRKALD